MRQIGQARLFVFVRRHEGSVGFVVEDAIQGVELFLADVGRV